MRNHGFTTFLLFSNLFCIDVTLMTVFFFSDPCTTYHFFLTILTANILTFLLPPNWKRTVSFLSLNGFPSHMFDHLAHRFLNKIFEPKPPVHTVPKKVVCFCLPFTGGSHSLQIRTQITRLCNYHLFTETEGNSVFCGPETYIYARDRRRR